MTIPNIAEVKAAAERMQQDGYNDMAVMSLLPGQSAIKGDEPSPVVEYDSQRLADETTLTEFAIAVLVAPGMSTEDIRLAESIRDAEAQTIGSSLIGRLLAEVLRLQALTRTLTPQP